MDYILRMIGELGFFGYIQTYPVNPITLLGGLAVIGIAVLVMNAKAKRSGANRFLAENPGAALVTLHKKKIGNNDYADNIRVVTLNGQKPRWFFIKPAVPALYIKPGENRIELYADWAKGGGAAVKMYKSEPVLMTLAAETGGRYSLEYYIPEHTYIFEPFVLP
jgi:hypothetical protein